MIYRTLVFILLVHQSLSADVVLKDHATNPANWNGESMIQQSLTPAVANIATGASAAFIGNGGTLESISGIFGHSSFTGVLNQGNPLELSFRVAFHSSTTEYIADPFLTSPVPGAQLGTFSGVSNADWLTKVGESSEGFDLFRWEIDISGLGIQTVAGETHLISLVPETSALSGSTFLAFSNGSTATGFEEDWFTSATLGPDTLTNLSAPRSFAALRVTATAVPEPSSALLLGLIALATVFQRWVTKYRQRCYQNRVAQIHNIDV